MNNGVQFIYNINFFFQEDDTKMISTLVVEAVDTDTRLDHYLTILNLTTLGHNVIQSGQLINQY